MTIFIFNVSLYAVALPWLTWPPHSGVAGLRRPFCMQHLSSCASLVVSGVLLRSRNMNIRLRGVSGVCEHVSECV